jgi:hypothetical protein
MGTQIEELTQRLDKLEEQNKQEILTLIELLANATFFGETKKLNCEYAKNGQCTFFIVKSEEKYAIPIVTKCRIKDCKEQNRHYHLELSNITCTLCQKETKQDKMFTEAFRNNSEKIEERLIFSRERGIRKNE